ncbi:MULTISPECIES: hypothetical protein [unclassified Microcoleus]|uniref:hypothetical protein n=1 Tax=unclassified Microcoleus TaxID=2642155 RepID=UPI0025D1A9BB|nr:MULTISPECIES: hypothetical protein [unclassified Microcoleus]
MLPIEPSTVNCQLSTVNSQQSTVNPQPSTINCLKLFDILEFGCQLVQRQR